MQKINKIETKINKTGVGYSAPSAHVPGGYNFPFTGNLARAQDGTSNPQTPSPKKSGAHL